MSVRVMNGFADFMQKYSL